ncbi:MAG TPA: hypothetical protein VGP26_26090 [Actinophytocola sp.]|jgi:DNA-binding MarR family transcriptional regulator|nr:hypothetical protein [Actinophytocola sp.]
MTQPRLFNGQDINIAAAATRGVLDTLLTSAGLTFLQFVALRAMPGERAAVAERAAGPAAPAPAVRAAIDELEAAGLANGDPVEPTARGRELFERITAESVRIGDRLFEGIPAADQATAKRVLDLITTRAASARAELTAQANSHPM